MDYFTSAVLVLGMGVCNHGGDYCTGLDNAGYPGKAAIELTVAETENKRVAFVAAATHYSDVSDNEWLQGHPFTTGDRGSEFFTVEMRVKLWQR